MVTDPPKGFGWVYTCTCDIDDDNFTSIDAAVAECGATICTAIEVACETPHLARVCAYLNCTDEVADGCIAKRLTQVSFDWIGMAALILQGVVAILLCAARLVRVREDECARINELSQHARNLTTRHKARLPERQFLKYRGRRKGRVDPTPKSATSSSRSARSNVRDDEADDKDAKWWWLHMARQKASSLATVTSTDRSSVSQTLNRSVPQLLPAPNLAAAGSVADIAHRAAPPSKSQMSDADANLNRYLGRTVVSDFSSALSSEVAFPKLPHMGRRVAMG